ncbi:MAG: hypothetical protein ACLP05_07970 [Candidatus Kryptoniota bacterium]
MPVYAYRWADGTVSVCSARDKEQAAWLFDEIGPVARKLIIRLKDQILVTTKLYADKGWVFDDDTPFGEDLYHQLLERCYPHYGNTFSKCTPDSSGGYSAKDMEKLRSALKEDEAEAIARIEMTPQMPDEFNLNPEGLPGQDN